MSYRIVVRGRADITVSDARGDLLKSLKLAVNPPKNVEINEDMYQLSQIMSIIHIPGQEHVPLADRQQSNLLENAKRCRGQYSIQKEINDMLKAERPDSWAKLIGDSTTRQKLYDQLRAQKGVTWCDYKKKECHCDQKL